jgi:DnaK suppressor protein
MATTKLRKAAPAKNTKKPVTNVPSKPAVKPQPKKTAAAKTPPKPAQHISVPPVKKPLAGKPALAAKPKDAKKLTAQPKTTKSGAPTPAAPKAAAKPAAAPADIKKPRFSKADLDQFNVELLAMRARITGQSGAMRTAALQRNDESNPEEDGTDAFMRLQTLEQVSSQQQIIANIDESLHAIEKGTYGVCDMCGVLINKPRLMVLPFAKNCITCQSEVERARRPGGRR